MDRIAIDRYGYSGLLLMKTAGERAFANIMARFSAAEPMVVLCGSGNNGGDGYVVAKCAQVIGLEVIVVQASAPKTKDTIQVCQEFVDRGGSIITSDTNDIEALRSAGLIIDGLFGTGLNRAPSGCYADLIRAANQASCQVGRQAGCPVVALDIPSGLDSDTGFAFDPCIEASMTVTFIGQKFGLFTGQGKNCSGQIKFEDLNLPADIQESIKPIAKIIPSPALKKSPLKKRKADSHKGDYGNIIIAGGDNGMLGAPLLAGRAALRCGSGRVTVLSTERHLDMPALHCPELMSQCIEDKTGFARLCEQCDVVVIGPGMGLSDWSKRIFDGLIELQKPMVIDADGLAFLAEAFGKRDHWVLTPHPGEAAKLLGCSTAEVQQNRLGAVTAISEKFGGVCVLKGAGTLVADASDASDMVGVCDRGNPGMATAGAGDVLAGMIGSLMGQDFDPGKAAQAGVWLHATCADKIAARIGMASLLAGDIIDALPETLSSVQAQAHALA